MKYFIVLFILFSFANVFSQALPDKHPRVAEVEEYLRDEASRYFTRRFPGEPFFVKVEVAPLRRDSIGHRNTQSLPYFDYESEEIIDEWDDANTPISFLRHRVTKVILEISIPESFSDVKVAEIKEELSIYLKLIPFRDEIKIQKKLKDMSPLMPFYVYPLLAGLLFSVLVGSFVVRSGLKKVAGSSDKMAPSVAASPQGPMPQSREESTPRKNSTAVSGDVNFHDPVKTADVVNLKIEQIGKSETFPTLNDLMTLHQLSESNPEKLAAIICEMPIEWQKKLFPLGNGESWLESFSRTSWIDHECLMVLDRITKSRDYVGPDRKMENLLIQVWRMREKSIPLFKKISQDHAFVILSFLPKSISLVIAKKSFPGAWGKLLENKSFANVSIAPKLIDDYLKMALDMDPYFEWKILDNYKKDRELLSYLDNASIDEEKDVYETLPADSFVLRVRPAFYKIFDQDEEQWRKFVPLVPIDKWALVAMNSSRLYIRQISDTLDEKQRIVFSQYLRGFDQGFSQHDQIRWRREIATLCTRFQKVETTEDSKEGSIHEKTA